MFFLVLSYIGILKKPNKILLIIQRSNGDVFLSLTLIKKLFEHYESPQIDLLVNDDTLAVAELFPYINKIIKFSYNEKKNNRVQQEKYIITRIFKKYDLSINLTASDRSVFYALLAAKKTISAVEIDSKKSWWKKLLLSSYYYFDVQKHILLNNLEALNLLEIEHIPIQSSLLISEKTISKIKIKLSQRGVENFIIFHPSAQYSYKIYPQHLRDQLLKYLNGLGVSIVVTGGSSIIDYDIKKMIPNLPNIINLIGETTLEEYFALSKLSLAYIGMDTLNMHIAAADNKRIFSIFGPTNLSMWSPWSNDLKMSATKNTPIQHYGDITIFQANMPCVACGNAGCDNRHGKSDCLFNINPSIVFNEVNLWLRNTKFMKHL